MFENPLTERIVGFLRRIGLPVRTAPTGETWLLPGLTIDRDGIAVDEAALKYPGDLLHEGGHLAVCEPARRASVDRDSFADAGGEIAAIAWSYAAALHLEIDPAVVFHPAGYKGGAAQILDNFRACRYFGVPLLQWYGMTHDAQEAARLGVAAYPAMCRWVR